MVATMPLSTTQAGDLLAFPDTCLTPAPPAPPIPIPYPNTAMAMQGNPNAKKVKAMNKEVLTEKSEISKSMGDEAGTNGGVASGMNMNKVKYMMGVTKVQAEGTPVVRMMSMTGHNGASPNMPSGNQLSPSQTKVLVCP